MIPPTEALYPEGRLFGYGTLMFPEVVQGLLGRSVPMRAAILRRHRRVAIDRGLGGAKGPIVVADENESVRGVALDGLTVPEQAMLHHFEDAAGGYLLEHVSVEIEGDLAVSAAAYVGGPELLDLVCGEWTAEAFAQNHLEHYLSERIPRIRRRWAEYLNGA